MTTQEAGRLGSQKRHQLEREPIRQKAREMRAQMMMKPHPGLVPVLILTANDRLN